MKPNKFSVIESKFNCATAQCLSVHRVKKGLTKERAQRQADKLNEKQAFKTDLEIIITYAVKEERETHPLTA